MGGVAASVVMIKAVRALKQTLIIYEERVLTSDFLLESAEEFEIPVLLFLLI